MFEVFAVWLVLIVFLTRVLAELGRGPTCFWWAIDPWKLGLGWFTLFVPRECHVWSAPVCLLACSYSIVLNGTGEQMFALLM